MKIVLKTTVLAAAVASAMMASSVAVAAPMAKAPAQASAKKPMQLLFVMSAKSARLSQSGQNYSLTLNHVDPHVVWFSDRPERKAGFVPLKVFLGAWSLPKSFGGNPPNAGFVHVGMESKKVGANHPMVMEISQPVYQHGKLSFKLNGLQGASSLSAGHYNNVRLFIDPMIGEPGSTGTMGVGTGITHYWNNPNIYAPGRGVY